MTTKLYTAADIVAVKNIGSWPTPVYMGSASAASGSENSGVWCRPDAVSNQSLVRSGNPHGPVAYGVGDLLAVSNKQKAPSVAAGDLVVLSQRFGSDGIPAVRHYTHLGVVWSEDLVVVEPNEDKLHLGQFFINFIWLKVIAMNHEIGADDDSLAPFHSGDPPAWFMPGGNFNKIEHCTSAPISASQPAFRDALWNAFLRGQTQWSEDLPAGKTAIARAVAA